VTTLLSYEATGELLSRTQRHVGANPDDIVVHQAFYDTLGRRVRSVEANSSIQKVVGKQLVMQGWIYAYNDNGDLVGTSDARGCGENFIYDKLGRLIAEDYSPCTKEQEPYSPPDFTTGEGIERLNVYDVPATPTGSVDDSVYQGHLTATFDRSQKSEVVLDARGRTNIVRRQLAVPGAGSGPFATRYAPRVYQKVVLENDEANRAIAVTTGAETPELRPANVGSWIRTVYTPRGTVGSVKSSYGDLIASQQLDAFGALRQRVLGDAASTTWSATYDEGRLLKALGIMRLPGPWLPQSPIYTPPGPSEPNTLQGVLTLTFFDDYDGVRNPKHILEFAAGADWPVGAAPAASKAFRYDDAYRLREVDIDYTSRLLGGSVDDAFTSPLAAEERRGDTSFPRIEGAPNRVRLEKFDYDWTGNTTLADDDAHIFDRSPGLIKVGAPHPHQIASATQGGATASPSYD
jgi:YD repeat-containing protein